VSPAEQARAQVELQSAIIELEKFKKELYVARRQLASTWGSREATFENVDGQFDVVTLPNVMAMQQLLEQNPDVARWAVEVLQRDAEWEYARAQRIPDLTIAGGYRRINETNDNAFVVGLALPLTIFDRNQGAIQAAELRRLQVEEEKRAVEISLNNRLLQIYDEASGALLEVTSLGSDVIPEAQKAYEMINDGYKMGKFGYLDIIEAQRSLFDVRSRYYTALQEYHHFVAELERLIGRPISDLQ
jgi:cobalt-zinc-cadmium efflux system outer membrane protein